MFVQSTGKVYNNVCKTMISKLLEIIEKTSPDSHIQLVVKTDNIAIKCYENFNFRVRNINTPENPLYPVYITRGSDISYYVMDRIINKRTKLQLTSDESISMFYKESLRKFKSTELFRYLK